MDFKPADLVRLRSGGEVMTVEKVGRYGGEIKVSAVWFEGTELRRAVFLPVVLELVEAAAAAAPAIAS
ncbi:DUF2158 domain-containing protein [Xinfangfangia sp. CPCC 101601]|uniref:DUF2158 domain-containing protein n=1 Tax=Pseudogemmobacter lacusdianii TaxID=3069608 RepID=A0ABU0VUW4_9RHOB|nr:DUF2158 domain-containing protein [Xinfangfangia sp. CPCC 101601]MDQ2065521.1 DUF2158 domain-containing protein [Xinfangfangia sp. CPCC 101601]